MNLYECSNQWSERPVDETFWNVKDAFDASMRIKESAAVATSTYSSLEFEGQDDRLSLKGSTGQNATLTYSATNQLCQRAKVPHSLIARQPAKLAATNLNWGLREYRGLDDKAVLLFHRNGSLVLRAATSEVYERLWNADFLAYINDTLDDSWVTPPARPSKSRHDDPRIRKATKEDVTGLEGISLIKEGDIIGPAGVYMSDKDLFVFVVSKNSIEGPTGPLNRFAFFFNNEIGTGSWGMTCGYFDVVCGNHIIWGAKGVREIKVRHVGERNVFRGVRKVRLELSAYADSSSSDDEQRLKKCATYEIAATRQETLDTVFAFAKKARIPELSMSRLEQGYDKAESIGRYGSPNTPWSLSSGLTELSQDIPHTDERIALERAAGRVLEIAF